MAEIKMPDDVVGNEFAAVAVAIDRSGNGPRLQLTDVHAGRSIYLDALALATLVWLPDGVLESWHDPAMRWREQGGEGEGDGGRGRGDGA